LVGIGFCELYAHDDLELQSSWSLPPEWLTGLSHWAQLSTHFDF
jgi:hypothetical protein